MKFLDFVFQTKIVEISILINWRKKKLTHFCKLQDNFMYIIVRCRCQYRKYKYMSISMMTKSNNSNVYTDLQDIKWQCYDGHVNPLDHYVIHHKSDKKIGIKSQVL